MTEVEIIGQTRGHSETSRRYDVDWLRVLGMMTVFLFHSNRFFDTGGWHVKSLQTSQASMMVTVFANEDFGGWSALPYLTLLIIGYLLATDDGPTKAMERHRVPALLAGIVSFALGYLAYKGTEQWSLLPRELVMSFVRGILCWAWLLAICGFAGRYLRFSNGFLKYANEAVLPFYILHQTVILTIGFYVIRLNTSLWVEYLIIAFSAFAVIVTMYELLIKRFNVLRFLFGMKLLARRQPVRAEEAVAAS